MNDLHQYYKPIEEVIEKRKLNVFTEIIDYRDDTEFQVRILKIKTASSFAFEWTELGKYIAYSAIYDLKPGVELGNDIKPDYPFSEIRLSKNKEKVEIRGLVKKEDFTKEKIDEVISSLVDDKHIFKKIHNLSEEAEEDNPPLKEECDENLYEVYRYFQTNSGAFIEHLYRHFKDMTMKELKSNLNTLENIGLIVQDENLDYEISSKVLAEPDNKVEVIKQINKEIKK